MNYTIYIPNQSTGACQKSGKGPRLDAGGVIFTDRETVDKVERMKVCTCLNPLHTALALFGCLLGYERISDEMPDPDLIGLVRGIGYVEGAKDAARSGLPRALGKH